MDLHNYLVGKGIGGQQANLEGLHLITKCYKKTDEYDCKAIVWYLRPHSRGDINLPVSLIVRDYEKHFCDFVVSELKCPTPKNRPANAFQPMCAAKRSAFQLMG